MIQRAYKYRLYPDQAQAEYFNKCFGCARFIWNKMLEDKQNYYDTYHKNLYVTPAKYKNDFPFLKEADSLALANVQLDLNGAFRAFFEKRTGRPKYKSKKRSRASYTTNNQNGTVAVTDRSIRLPKIGYVRAVIHREIPEGSKIKSATVSRTVSGKYYCSVLCEIPADKKAPLIIVENTKVLGLDYSSGHFYVDSQGSTADEPHWLRVQERKLRRAQRKLSRMIEANISCYTGRRVPVYKRPLEECRNIQKQRKKIAVIHERISNQRDNWCHQESRKIANSCDAVVLEDIDLKGLAGALRLGKATNDNGFGQFRRYLEYKMEEQGKYVIVVDRFFPSSQICSVCGCKEPSVKDLKVRRWVCPQCGTEHDRDINAAVNLRNEGIRVLYTNKIQVI